MKEIAVYCARSGHIGFGRNVPEGALTIARGEEKELKAAIAELARLSHPSKPGRKDSVPLVPGLPEAANEAEAWKAYSEFSSRVARKLNVGIDLIETARENPNEIPDTFVIALCQNRLDHTLSSAGDLFLSIVKVGEAYRHLKSRVPEDWIKKTVKKWGRK